MKWKLALFDWNGTSIDDLHITHKYVIALFNKYGVIPPSLDDYRNTTGSHYLECLYKWGIPRSASREEINAVWTKTFEKHWNDVSLVEDLLPTISRIRHYVKHVGIVSGDVHDIILRRMHQFNLIGIFDHIRGSAWPKEDALCKTIEHFNLLPHQSFYVDDTHEGLMCAKRIGITTFGYTDGYALRARIEEANPDFVIDSLSEIVDIIQS